MPDRDTHRTRPLPRPVPDLAWRAWDDGAVVYRATTGDTHFLDPASAAVLIALCQEPDTGRARLADSLRRLAPDAAEATDDRLAAWVDTLLSRLVEAGLARAAPIPSPAPAPEAAS